MPTETPELKSEAIDNAPENILNSDRSLNNTGNMQKNELACSDIPLKNFSLEVTSEKKTADKRYTLFQSKGDHAKNITKKISKIELNIINNIRNNVNNKNIPENLLIYKTQNKHVREPNYKRIETIKRISHNTWVFDTEITDEIINERCFFVILEHLYYRLYHDEIMLSDLKLKSALKQKRDDIEYFRKVQAREISENAEDTLQGLEASHVIRDDTNFINTQLEQEQQLKDIIKLNRFNKEKIRKVVDWKKTAENIYNLLN